MNRIRLFTAWYKKLTSQGYGAIVCISYAWYNSKYYTIDGKYK